MLKLTSCINNLSAPLQKQAFASLLECCSSQLSQLKQIHALLLTTGISVKNSLITQLLTSLTLLGNMSYARSLFDEMHKPRIFIWSTLIRGYVKNSLYFEAIALYVQMRQLGVCPDRFTFPFVLKGCSELTMKRAGVEFHAHVVKFGVEFDSIVSTELMIMYARMKEMITAEYVFESMTGRDLVAWNALISAYVQNGHGSKALGLFRKMCSMGIKPDPVTFVSVLAACAHLGCLEIGKEIDRFIVGQNVKSNLILNNARLDMYLKCGSLDMAGSLFEEMTTRNVISWSTMICGYAINGESSKALSLFSQMREERVKPNHVTFLGLLSACSHAGLVSEGKSFFEYMIKCGDHDLLPRVEHYACMVDLLGRSGHLEEAYNFIKCMPIEPDSAVWGALLGACTIHQNIELGQQVADLLFREAPDTGSYHVLLSNIYAAAGRWNDVNEVRQRMRKQNIKKIAGYSSVEYDGEIHVFHGGDRSHPQSGVVYEFLEELVRQMRNMGYVPKISAVLHDVDIEEKEATLGTHSEKLAIAFGLINLRHEYPIRVMKNLRVCDDCHNFSKFVSKITNREIIMRDKNRFHHFRDGFCSCKDFW